MISHTTAQFRKMFAELPVEVQRQARRAYRVFTQNPNQPSLRFKPVHLTRQFILFGSVLVIEQWESWKTTKSSGTGSARMRTMINFFHNRGVDPDPWVEKDAEDAPLTRSLRCIGMDSWL